MEIRCSFCGRGRNAVGHLIANDATAVAICDGCIQTSAEALGLTLAPRSDLPEIAVATRTAIGDIDRLIAAGVAARHALATWLPAEAEDAQAAGGAL
jgi:ATP-dependent protease Clp ATPase subunit